MTDVEKLIAYQDFMGLNGTEMGELFGVTTRAYRQWRGGHSRVPKAVLMVIENGKSAPSVYDLEQAKTIYRIIQELQEQALEIASLKREIHDINTARATNNPNSFLRTVW